MKHFPPPFVPETPEAKGSVKWFNDRKGFGFILMDLTHEQIFVHYSTIEKEGYKTLQAGERVRFSYEETQTGIQALQVWPETEEEGTHNASHEFPVKKAPLENSPRE